MVWCGVVWCGVVLKLGADGGRGYGRVLHGYVEMGDELTSVSCERVQGRGLKGPLVKHGVGITGI